MESIGGNGDRGHEISSWNRSGTSDVRIPLFKVDDRSIDTGKALGIDDSAVHTGFGRIDRDDCRIVIRAV